MTTNAKTGDTVGYVVVIQDEDFWVIANGCGAPEPRERARAYRSLCASSDPRNTYRIARVVLDK